MSIIFVKYIGKFAKKIATFYPFCREKTCLVVRQDR